MVEKIERLKGGSRGASLLSIFLLVFLLVAFPGCGNRQAYKRVQLYQLTPKISAHPQGDAAAPLRVAVAGVVSAKESRVSYQALLAHLGHRLNRPVEWVQRD
ncbi:MAG: hypothetical protein HYU64_15685, partial [Armatimonadetes bacterium]|nr:hypothetical protein [Armatimonadota bacterium]